MARSVEIARAFITLEAETKGLDNQLSQAEKSLGRMATFVKAHPLAALVGLGTAAIAAGLKLANMAAEVDKSFHLIAASIPEATNRLQDLRKEASTLSQGFGISQKEIADGMLALARSGISSVDELIIANRAAVEAARATGADFGTVVSLLDSALDAFNLQAKDSNAILAKLFVTSQGKTDFSQLAPVFEAVGKAAIKSGVDWKILAEATVTLQTQGLKAKQIITALSKGLDEEGAPAVRKLAAASHVASDGVAEMAAQTERMNKTLPVIQAQLREKLNAELLDIGRTALPLVIKGLEAVQAILATFGGGNKKILDDAAVGTLESTLAVLGKLPKGSEAAKQALDDLSGSLTRLSGVDVSGKTIKELGNLQKGLSAAQRSGVLTGTVLQKVGVSLSAVNAEIRKRGDKPLVPPVDPKAAEGLRGLTAGLLATGDAAKKSAKAMEELQKIAGKAELELLSAQHREHEELVRSFRDKMQDLSAADHAKAEVLLKKALTNQLLAWAGFGEGLETMAAQLPQKFVPVLDLAGKSVTNFDDVLEKHGKHLDDVGVKADLASIQHQEFTDNIVGLAQITAESADAILNMARSFGIATPEMEAFAGGIADIAEGIGRIAAGDLLGGLTAGAAGLAGVVKMFTSESASSRFLRLALETNSKRLEESSRAIGNLTDLQTPGGQISKIEKALDAFFKNPLSGQLGAAGGTRNDAVERAALKALMDALLAQGIGAEQLDAFAKSRDIAIRDDKGRLDPRLLRQLLEEIANLEPTRFGADFQGRRDQLRAETDLFDLTPAQQAEKLAALAAGFLEGLTGQRVGGLDFSSAGGRESALDTIQKLFQGLMDGTIATSDLGGLTGKDLLDVLTELKNLLESAEDAPLSGPGVTTDRPPIDVALDPNDTIQVEDPVSVPILEQIFGVNIEERDLLQGILDRMPAPGGVAAPALPAVAMAGFGASGASVSYAFNFSAGAFVVEGSGNPAQDGRALADALLDELMAARLENALLGQGINTRFFR